MVLRTQWLPEESEGDAFMPRVLGPLTTWSGLLPLDPRPTEMTTSSVMANTA